MHGREVLGLEDEYFVDPAGRPEGPASVDGGQGGERLLSDGMVLGGPGALLSALGLARTGRMGDIVATIQREQDEIIRSPLPGVLIVQGGPGTGKTAVALHRAAYLLYTHRFPLERQGVLVVGPNPLFLRYIEQVLPSLGETGVSLSTVAGLVPEVRVRGVDDPAVAKLKGDVRMVKVLGKAIAHVSARCVRHEEIPFGAGVLRLHASRRLRRSSHRPPAAGSRMPAAAMSRRRLRDCADEYGPASPRWGHSTADDAPSRRNRRPGRRLRRVPRR